MMVAVFSRAYTDDTTHEVEVNDIAIDGFSVDDATTGRGIAKVEATANGLQFLPDTAITWFDTLTVVPKPDDSHFDFVIHNMHGPTVCGVGIHTLAGLVAETERLSDPRHNAGQYHLVTEINGVEYELVRRR